MVRCRHLVKNAGEMMNKTNLIGYSYSLEEGKLARDDGRLLSVRVETSLACNMRCRYCAWDSGVPLTDEIGFDTLKSFISDGIEKGIRSVIIIGGGEPTIYKHFRELVEFIDSKGIIPVVITNGLTVTPEFSTFLYEHNCSVLLKNDSFDEETQNYLSGVQGAFKKMQASLKNLIDAGFTKEHEEGLRLGLSFVATKKNIDEIGRLWRFCRDNNIYPNLELLNPIGRAEENADAIIPEHEETNRIINEVKNIDEEYGLHHKVQPTCLQHLYSMYLNVEGHVQPCGAIRIKDFNYSDYSSLDECYDSPYFKRIRGIEKHLDEKAELTYFNM